MLRGRKEIEEVGVKWMKIGAIEEKQFGLQDGKNR